VTHADTVARVTSSVVAGRAAEQSQGRPDAPPGFVNAALIVVIVLWGVGPPVTKLVSAPPLVGASIRFWMSVPIVWGFTYLSGRRITLSVLRHTAIPGVLFATNMTFLFASLQRSSVTILSVVQALTPGLVLVVAGRWLGERPTLRHVMWTALGVGGVLLVVLGGDPEVSGDVLGFLFAVVSTLAFSGYYVINRRVRSSTAIDPVQWIAGVTLFAAIALTPIALLGSSPDDYGKVGVADWVYLAFVAGMVGIVSHVLMSWIHAYMPASKSSPALLGANVVAIGVAWPLHDEPVTWLQVVGGIVVLASVLAILRKPTVARDDTEEEPPLPTV
jgi:O-acetylserine/cysteine efflux transporter